MLLNTLEEHPVGISDFEMLRFVVLWCHRNSADVKEFIEYIDFSRFSLEERKFALDNGVPFDVAFNALNKSTLLSKASLQHFNLQVLHCFLLTLQFASERWKFYYRASYNKFRFSRLTKALESVNKKLILLKFDDNSIVSLFIGKKMQMEQETAAEFQVSAFFFGHGFNTKSIQ